MLPIKTILSQLVKRSSLIPAQLIVLSLLLLLTGCHRSVRIALHSAGHSITVFVEGDHSIDTSPTGAVIRTQYGDVSVERSRVKLNELDWVAIPADVPVSVGISKHKRWLKAESVTIRQTSR